MVLAKERFFNKEAVIDLVKDLSEDHIREKVSNRDPLLWQYNHMRTE